MNEPEILEAYRDLSSPTSPPDDLLARVDRRIRRRRATRRGLAGVAALAVAGGIGVVTLGGGDDGGESLVADQGGTDTSTLTYTDVDGSTYTFDAADLEIACSTPEPGAPQRLILSRGDEAQPVLYADFVVDKVEPGEVFQMPVDGPGGSDTYPMLLFFTNGTDDGANELTSAMMDATGTITVHEAACGPTPSLWFEVDATLGSEVEQPALAIKGEYRS